MPQTNLLINPTFDSDASNWGTSHQSVTLTHETTIVYEGAGSGQIDLPGTGQTNPRIFATIANTPGVDKLLVAQAWVLAPVGQELSITAMLRNDSDIYINGFQETHFIGTGSWQYVQDTRVTTSDTGFVEFGLGKINITDDSAISFYVDSAWLYIAQETQTVYVPRRSYVRR